LAHLFGGKERFKDTCLTRRIDTAARVRYANTDVVISLGFLKTLPHVGATDRFSADRNAARGPDGIAGIDAKIK
jgi:hypothetical protein